MKKRFASFLLTGKAAALPILFQEATAAQVFPSYTDLTTDKLTLVNLPIAGKFQMEGSGAYGAPTLCTGATLDTFSTVVTGLKPGDTVFVIASTSKNSTTLQSFNKDITVGDKNVLVVSQFVYDPAVQLADASDMTLATGTVTIPVKIPALAAKGYLLTAGGKIYLQAVVLGRGVAPTAYSQYRLSSLNEITVAQCNSTYGTTPYGGY